MKTSETRVEIAAPDIFIMGCLISIMFRNSLIIPPANIIIMALCGFPRVCRIAKQGVAMARNITAIPSMDIGIIQTCISVSRPPKRKRRIGSDKTAMPMPAGMAMILVTMSIFVSPDCMAFLSFLAQLSASEGSMLLPNIAVMVGTRPKTVTASPM